VIGPPFESAAWRSSHQWCRTSRNCPTKAMSGVASRAPGQGGGEDLRWTPTDRCRPLQSMQKYTPLLTATTNENSHSVYMEKKEYRLLAPEAHVGFLAGQSLH